MVINDDPVLQPSVSVGFGGFAAGVWGNMDLTEINNDRFEFNETDYFLEYTLDLPLLSLTLGISRYDYSIAGWEPTSEAYFAVAAGLPGNPSATVYRDVDKADGTYVELGAGQDFPVMPFANLEISAILGWGSGKHNRYNYGISGMGAGFTEVTVAAGLPVGIGDFVSVTPSLGLSCPLNDDLRDEYDTVTAVFWVSASASF